MARPAPRPYTERRACARMHGFITFRRYAGIRASLHRARFETISTPRAPHSSAPLSIYAQVGWYSCIARALGGRRVPEKPRRADVPSVLRRSALVLGRADVCNAVDELGQLLDHSGAWRRPSGTRRASSTAIKKKKKDHCFSSPTARPPPTRWCGTPRWIGRRGVRGPQLPQVDMHDFTKTGAIPVFLMRRATTSASSAPIPLSRVRFWENIEEKIRAHPFEREVKTKPLRADTSIRDVRRNRVYQRRDHQGDARRKIDTLLFDEAWLPHATFTTTSRHARHRRGDRPRCKESFSSRPSPRQAARGLSQASKSSSRTARSVSVNTLHTSTRRT